MDRITYHASGAAQSFEGKAVDVFTMAVMASGLRLYAKTGMRPNRAYTPKAMLETAGRLLGWDDATTRRAIRTRAYVSTADALSARVGELKAKYAAEEVARVAASQEGGR